MNREWQTTVEEERKGGGAEENKEWRKKGWKIAKNRGKRQMRGHHEEQTPRGGNTLPSLQPQSLIIFIDGRADEQGDELTDITTTKVNIRCPKNIVGLFCGAQHIYRNNANEKNMKMKKI